MCSPKKALTMNGVGDGLCVCPRASQEVDLYELVTWTNTVFNNTTLKTATQVKEKWCFSPMEVVLMPKKTEFFIGSLSDPEPW